MKTWADFGIDIGSGQGQTYTTCPQCSKDRKKRKAKCLSVNVPEGVWLCHHCGWSGTLKDGGERPRLLHWQKPTYRKPVIEEPDKLTPGSRTWLNKRGITDDVIDRNKIFTGSVYMPQVEDFVTAIGFPYFRDDELVNVKWRDKDKNFRMEAGAERVLYGINDISETTIIVEGEVDKLSVEVSGLRNCLSVPDGAPAVNTRDYSSKFDFLNDDRLELVKTWVIAVDNDEPGKLLEDELSRRLGRENCRRVTWPDGCKDANDVLQKHGNKMLRQCIDNAKAYPIEGGFSVADIESDLDHLFDNGMPKGVVTGWPAMDDNLTLLPGQMTVVTGIPSHGKSEFMDALAVNMAYKGWRFAMFSPENHPISFHAVKLAEKVMGCRLKHAQRETFEKAKAWIMDRFWFVSPDKPDLDTLLAITKQMVRRHGVNALLIDPWNEIEHTIPIGMNETTYVSLCLTRIRMFARQHDLHVFIVAHPTKLQKTKEGTYPVPTPYDISGSANWRNKADNCIAVWRDVLNEGGASEIHIQKVRFRFLGKAGMVSLWWQPESGRYTDVAQVVYSGCR